MKKYNKGITLIALVITIIILLVLAMVSIKLIRDHDIVKYSQTATNEYKNKEIQEKIKLAYSSWKMASITDPKAKLKIDGAEITDWEDSENGARWSIKINGENIFLDENGNIVTSGTEGLFVEKEDGTKQLICVTNTADGKKAVVIYNLNNDYTINEVPYWVYNYKKQFSSWSLFEYQGFDDETGKMLLLEDFILKNVKILPFHEMISIGENSDQEEISGAVPMFTMTDATKNLTLNITQGTGNRVNISLKDLSGVQW